ncbi:MULTISPECIES: hypothetical protein [Streptomyces]|uniref:Teneurin NHL domain-containing protein n=1 Tax=Streptomyces flaveolus TaxID=67297 RepID=A0ABV3APN6_9ACTN|nr:MULTISPECIES: hypothetical protein [Streptomyces]
MAPTSSATAAFPDGTIITAAGNGEAGFVVDGGPAVGTKLQYPYGVAVDREGNLYIADQNNHRVRKVAPNGILTTVAGNGVAGYIADGGPGVGERLYYPYSVAVASSGDLYIGDSHNHRAPAEQPREAGHAHFPRVRNTMSFGSWAVSTLPVSRRDRAFSVHDQDGVHTIRESVRCAPKRTSWTRRSHRYRRCDVVEERIARAPDFAFPVLRT